MRIKHTKQTYRARRHRRVRALIQGTAQRPRVSIFKSNQHMYVQVVDDAAGKTILGMSDVSIKLPPKTPEDSGTKVRRSYALGELIAKELKTKKISEALFDRGGFKYHGRVRAVAEALRKAGIKV